jgi:RNA polymerase sigma factor (sigma-70 family)
MIRPVPYWARLMRFCQVRGRSREDAEDLIQTALLRLEEYCRSAAGRSIEVRNKEQFLAKTIRNLVVDQVRHERVVTYAPEPVEELSDSLPLVDSNPTPDRILEAQQRLDEITRVLGTVGKRVTQVYLLHMAGYEYREIGAALTISVSTVERDVARAVLTMAQSGVPK